MCRATLRCDSAALQKPSAQDKARSKSAVLAAGMQEDLASLREKLTVKDVSTLKSSQHWSRWTCCMPLKVLTSVSSIGLWHERVSAQGTNPAMLAMPQIGKPVMQGVQAPPPGSAGTQGQTYQPSTQVSMFCPKRPWKLCVNRWLHLGLQAFCTALVCMHWHM